MFEPFEQLYVPSFWGIDLYSHSCTSLRVYGDINLIVQSQDKKQASDIFYA